MQSLWWPIGGRRYIVYVPSRFMPFELRGSRISPSFFSQILNVHSEGERERFGHVTNVVLLQDQQVRTDILDARSSMPVDYVSSHRGRSAADLTSAIHFSDVPSLATPVTPTDRDNGGAYAFRDFVKYDRYIGKQHGLWSTIKAICPLLESPLYRHTMTSLSRRNKTEDGRPLRVTPCTLLCLPLPPPALLPSFCFS